MSERPPAAGRPGTRIEETSAWGLLFDACLRLQACTGTAALHQALLGETRSLLGAQRVLLVLDEASGPVVAAAWLPRQDTPAAMLRAIGPWLQAARRTRAPTLRHGPAGAAPRQQRSCLVAPLLADGALLGWLYADLDGRRGRFDHRHTERLALLAQQAARALASQREREVLATRAAQLAVLERIQQGIAASLDFNGIVELVGERLREVLRSDDISIRWFDPATGLIEFPYVIEHGRRIEVAPQPPTPGGPWERIVASRQPLRVSGTLPLPGTELALDDLFVPIIGSDEVLGLLTIEDHTRRDAFGEAELRLLTTVAAALGVALQSAQRFDQTQRLQRETGQRNAELAVINSVQQGLAGSLDFQGIVDAVGDKLREVFRTDDLSIRWIDEATGAVQLMYGYEHGVRLPFHTFVPPPDGPLARFIAARQAQVVGSVDEQLALGIAVRPGTDRARSLMNVPMLIGERMIGFVLL
ncbi:GAF domain-containing protein, partial [Aquabacterium sp.]|uniref:GAF domain-containing protein n=1 Tax=Aquabacterium sp. TaxID=1872578 RepID=UPI003784D4B2